MIGQMVMAVGEVIIIDTKLLKDSVCRGPFQLQNLQEGNKEVKR